MSSKFLSDALAFLFLSLRLRSCPHECKAAYHLRGFVVLKSLQLCRFNQSINNVKYLFLVFIRMGRNILSRLS